MYSSRSPHREDASGRGVKKKKKKKRIIYSSRRGHCGCRAGCMLIFGGLSTLGSHPARAQYSSTMGPLCLSWEPSKKGSRGPAGNEAPQCTPACGAEARFRPSAASIFQPRAASERSIPARAPGHRPHQRHARVPCGLHYPSAERQRARGGAGPRPRAAHSPAADTSVARAGLRLPPGAGGSPGVPERVAALDDGPGQLG
ncbi:hypothetical protein NDU88_009139 [Pleurodeles waltl]|uniref:Uncharacterized protein n=1 Tax=Pleurodeles waltl TaxID=8319 RepID=A0AAV7P1C2_PLEWA|nr:hypothetical protein NDU88_009139 [Pleurodeles waltl]